MTLTIADEYAARARELQPLIEKHGAEGDIDRRVSDTVFDAISDAGSFRIMTPKRYGGAETDVRTHLAVSAEVAKGDGAAGWVTGLTNVCGWLAGTLNQKAQDDIWGTSPDTRIAGVTAPTSTATAVDGGWNLTGSWSWASGSMHAQWGIGGMPILSDAGELVDQKIAFFPMADAKIVDTWFTAGMRGSGSNTITVDNITIPEHRTLSLFQGLGGVHGTPHTGEVLYQSAMVPVLAIILVGPMLGMASKALELVIGQATTKPLAYTFYPSQAASQVFQHQLAEAASKIETAYLHAFRCADTIDADAKAGRFPDRVSRARACQDTGWVTRN